MAETVDDYVERIAREDDDNDSGSFKALIIGDWGTGKTRLLTTARKPVWVDSFDPNGSVGLLQYKNKRQIIVDSYWEKHTKDNILFESWYDAFQERQRQKLFDRLGTYCLDSISTWAICCMDYIMNKAGRKGEAPKWAHDYVPQRVYLENIMREILALPCDVIAIGHLAERFKKITTRTGEVVEEFDHYKFKATGQAVTTIPIMFSEVYCMLDEADSQGKKNYKMITSRTNVYPAKSRLAGNGGISHEEEPNIKNILKKAGYPFGDKPLFKRSKDNEKEGSK